MENGTGARHGHFYSQCTLSHRPGRTHLLVGILHPHTWGSFGKSSLGREQDRISPLAPWPTLRAVLQECATVTTTEHGRVRADDYLQALHQCLLKPVAVPLCSMDMGFYSTALQTAHVIDNINS